MKGVIKLNNKYCISKIAFLAIMLAWFIPVSVFSQAWVNSDHKAENLMGIKKGWFVGADFGANIYYGAIALYNDFPKPKDFKKSLGRGYSFYGGKKFKYGLSAEAQLFKGTMQGYKISPPIYDRKFTGEMLSYSVSAKYNLSQLMFRQRQERKFFNRLGLYATVGFGQVFYRSVLYKYATGNNQWYIENTTGYKAEGIDSHTGAVITSKSKMASALILPVGGKINFKLNKNTDLVLDIYYVNVFSKTVDSWNRPWTHNDKYLYTALGICYNFGRSDDDEVPDNQRMLRPHSKRKSSTSSDDDSDIKMPSSTGKRGLFKRKSNKEDKDLELKLKIYEMQLKLFEMQFLTQ